ncbi:MAG: DNA gyrase inhibitor YacG, partial [Thermoguttaceae bacterium]
IMPLLRCPVCNKSFEYVKVDTMPFCSERCRQIDLGRWLDERYGLLYEPPVNADEAEIDES